MSERPLVYVLFHDDDGTAMLGVYASKDAAINAAEMFAVREGYPVPQEWREAKAAEEDPAIRWWLDEDTGFYINEEPVQA